MTPAGPLVSVLMPTYNHRAFLAESLDSILAQDYPWFEIVVTDDASSDGAQELLREYAARHPLRIKALLARERGGVTVNCNRAWSVCTGQYVALMSGDDVMYPGKLRRQVELMERTPACVICYHDLNVFDSDTRVTLRRWNTHSDYRPRSGGAADLIIYGTFIGACSAMLRRLSCPAHGFDPRIPIASDWLFLIETAASGGHLAYIDAVLGGYRRHGNNVTSGHRGTVESLRTLILTEAKYPTYAAAVRKGRGRLYYAQAVIMLRSGRRRRARLLLRAAWAQGWRTWKLVVRWLLLVCG